MQYLTLNLIEGSKVVESWGSPQTPAFEQELPSLQLRKLKQGPWGQNWKEGQWGQYEQTWPGEGYGTARA